MRNYDEHQSYGSPDEEDVKEFATLHPIAKGLLVSAVIGVGVSLIIFLLIYLTLEGMIT